MQGGILIEESEEDYIKSCSNSILKMTSSTLNITKNRNQENRQKLG